MDDHTDMLPKTIGPNMAVDQSSRIMDRITPTDNHYRTTQDAIKAEALALGEIYTSTSAASMRERLGKYIYDFESELDLDHEIGAELVSFGRTMTFHITNIGTSGPDIITFYGVTDDGGKLQLVQHISQLSVLLMAVKKIGEKPCRIGFVPSEHANQFI